MRPLIYVAGPLSELPISYLGWLAKMNDEALWLFQGGWAPVIPGNDLLFCYRSPILLSKNDLLEIDHSLIVACYAMRVLSKEHDNGKPSEGVLYEIEVAKDSGVKVCYTREEVNRAMHQYRGGI